MIANMERDKPDLAAYRHFLGSEVGGNNSPDTRNSAACAVAAGCVAASRPKHIASRMRLRAARLRSWNRLPASPLEVPLDGIANRAIVSLTCWP